MRFARTRYPVRATYPTSNTSSSTTTDAEGRVLFKLNFGGLFGSDEAGRAKPVHLELVPLERSMSGDARIELDVSPPHENGVRDLGDVVLPSVPVVLSGTVVDDLGQPVPEVYVFVNQGRSVGADEQGTTWFNPRPRASDEVEEKVTHSWSPRARAITDATGHFVMRG